MKSGWSDASEPAAVDSDFWAAGVGVATPADGRYVTSRRKVVK
jgi:hypothetical protein